MAFENNDGRKECVRFYSWYASSTGGPWVSDPIRWKISVRYTGAKKKWCRKRAEIKGFSGIGSKKR